MSKDNLACGFHQYLQVSPAPGAPPGVPGSSGTSPSGKKEKKAEYQRRYRKENENRIKAHHGSSRKLVKERPDHCQVCGKTCKPDGHHEDHDKPDEVIWACRECHRSLDKAKREREKGLKP